MNILVDLCVEADGLMFQKLIERLRARDHEVFVTMRKIPQALKLFKLLGIEGREVGDYSLTREGKLVNSTIRAFTMTNMVLAHLGKKLDAVVSNTGVEACRVGFGLGAKVHTFHDHPEAYHQMMLTIPLSTHIYIPWVIDRGIYHKYGIHAERIFEYKGFLMMAWMPYFKPDPQILEKLKLDPDKPIVVFRESETGAAYLFGRKDITVEAVKTLATKYSKTQFVARPRYGWGAMVTKFASYPNVKIFVDSIDMRSLLAKADLFIGGGATMSLEAAYLGTPTICCRLIEAPITRFLVPQDLAWQANTSREIVTLADKHMGERIPEPTRSILTKLEFPLDKLLENIENPTVTRP